MSEEWAAALRAFDAAFKKKLTRQREEYAAISAKNEALLEEIQAFNRELKRIIAECER